MAFLVIIILKKSILCHNDSCTTGKVCFDLFLTIFFHVLSTLNSGFCFIKEIFFWKSWHLWYTSFVGRRDKNILFLNPVPSFSPLNLNEELRERTKKTPPPSVPLIHLGRQFKSSLCHFEIFKGLSHIYQSKFASYSLSLEHRIWIQEFELQGLRLNMKIEDFPLQLEGNTKLHWRCGEANGEDAPVGRPLPSCPGPKAWTKLPEDGSEDLVGCTGRFQKGGEAPILGRLGLKLRPCLWGW